MAEQNHLLTRHTNPETKKKMEKSIRQVGFASSHLGHYVCDALERIKRIVEEVSKECSSQ